MAIHDMDTISNKNGPPYLFSFLSKTPGSGRSIKPINDADSIKRGKTRKKKNSPYLFGDDKVQLMSRIGTEKKGQKNSKVYSSFPLATNLYRASSDEFKALKKMRRKARKSVLTLPNVPAPIPNACTVSDMNDSDYLNNKNEKKIRPPNRFPNRKIQSRTRGIEFYDRDAHCFDSSSHNMLLKNGDCKVSPKAKGKCRDDMQDVWSVLRNINKFHFRPTPRISDEDSLFSEKKKTISRKFRTRKGRRLIGTCRTEEVAYVADIEIQSKTSASQSSSFDRITVIDKIDLQNGSKLDKSDMKVQSPRRIQYKVKNLIPLHEKKNNQNAPNLKTSQGKENRKVTQMNKIFTKKVNDASVNQKRPESHYNIDESMDSSNCFRISDNEESNCTLKPKLTLIHPNEFKHIIFNSSPQNELNFTNKEDSLKRTIYGQAPTIEKNTNGTTQIFNTTTTRVNSIINKGPLKSIMNKGPLKPRLVTTMPSAATMPKFAVVADIKRRLANYRFPLIVLGKDEVSSTLEVFDYEPPQFGGLNDHIWPFMLEWKKKPSAQKRSSPRPTQAMRKVANELPLARSRDKKAAIVELASKKNINLKRGVQQDTTIPPSGLKKIKPMRQFKDKMLKLLYKNSYPIDYQFCQNTEPIKVTITDKDKDMVHAGTEMSVRENKMNENPKKTGNTNKLSTTASKVPILPGRVEIREQNRVPKKLDDIIDNAHKPYDSLQVQNMKMPGARHPWARAKWASDFIDNIIKKIKNGYYYGIEEKNTTNYDKENMIDKVALKEKFNDCGVSEEVSIQTCNQQSITKVDFEQNFNESVYEETDIYDPFLKIPGFDDTLPNLKIKTLSATQIQVKNCVTNVMVYFDVSVPNTTSCQASEKKSSTMPSFTPLSPSESNTRIYKCSTAILNAALPAELCSVLPKLMKNIFDSDTTLASTALPTLSLSEISDFDSEVQTPLHRPSSPMNDTWLNQYYLPYNAQPHPQNAFGQYLPYNQWVGPQNPWTLPQNKLMGPQNPWYYPQNPWTGPNNLWVGAQYPPNGPVSPYLYGWPEYLPTYMSPRLINILQGRFGYSLKKRSKLSRCDLIKVMKQTYEKDAILPKIDAQGIMTLIVNPMKSISYYDVSPDNVKMDNQILVNKTVDCSCTAIQLYKPETKWIPSISDFTNLIQKMWNYFKFNVHYVLSEQISILNTNIITVQRDNLTVGMIVDNTQGVKSTVSLTFTHVNNCVVDSNHSMAVANIFEIVELSEKSEDCSKEVSVIRDIQLAKKIKDRVKKKRYVNLRKKCKSITYGNEYNMPLSKISSIEDFTIALGAAKSLCSVFDERSSQKVLSYVKEMKEWIKDISSGQALLVLLLANKKETPNLLRFYPILLQGIAVNRITRMTELDMETEVIERENMQLGECEGITCIRALAANQDSLFDELCWIAKTTASDYQKPFDDASVRLLRSLLGKRKKLNPSYLRVMARYVGLGLLKKP